MEQSTNSQSLVSLWTWRRRALSLYQPPQSRCGSHFFLIDRASNLKDTQTFLRHRLCEDAAQVLIDSPVGGHMMHQCCHSQLVCVTVRERLGESRCHTVCGYWIVLRTMNAHDQMHRNLGDPRYHHILLTVLESMWADSAYLIICPPRVFPW